MDYRSTISSDSNSGSDPDGEVIGDEELMKRNKSIKFGDGKLRHFNQA